MESSSALWNFTRSALRKRAKLTRGQMSESLTDNERSGGGEQRGTAGNVGPGYCFTGDGGGTKGGDEGERDKAGPAGCFLLSSPVSPAQPFIFSALSLPCDA